MPAAIVQSARQNGFAFSFTITMPAPLTAGNALLIGLDLPVTVTSIVCGSDTVSTTPIYEVSPTDVNGKRVRWFLLTDLVGGDDEIVISFPAGGGGHCVAFEVSGLGISPTLEESVEGSLPGTTSPGAPISPAAAGNLVAVGMFGAIDRTWSARDGSTFLTGSGSNPAYDCWAALVSAASGSQSVGATTNANLSGDYVAVSLIPDAGGTSDPITIDASATEANETLSSEIAASVAVAASITEPAETLSAELAAAVAVETAFTEPNETLSAAVQSPATLSAMFTEPDETLAAVVTLPVAVEAANTEGDEQLAAGITVALVLAADVDEPGETLDAEVITDGDDIVASFTEPNETLQSAIATGLAIEVEVEETDSLDMAMGLGVVVDADPVEANETLQADIIASGEGISLVAAEANEALAAAIVVDVGVASAVAEPVETLVAAIGVEVRIGLAAPEAGETIVSLMRLAIGVSVDRAEAGETISAQIGFPTPGRPPRISSRVSVLSRVATGVRAIAGIRTRIG